MKKLSLSNLWLFLIFLAILMETKNHGILKTMIKIQFHHKFWTWPIPNHWQIGKFLFQWDWTWRWCDTNSQCCDSVSLFKSTLTPVSLSDLDPIPKPTLIPIPIELKHEPPILDSQVPPLGNECELQSYDLDQTHELTLTLEPKLNLSFILKSVSVPIPFIV